VKGFLLDTNVISELRKRARCAPAVDAWARSVPPEEQFLSVIVIGELTRGIALKSRTDPVAADSLAGWIERLVTLYGDRILPVSIQVATAWGSLGAIRPMPPEDGLLAATARVHDLTLVTRNIRNVEGLGVLVLNPWSH